MTTFANRTAAMMTSVRHDWATPSCVFDPLNREFGFTLDVCAHEENAKCERFFTVRDDGLSQTWTGTCWMNPPYGKDIGAWIAKARRSAGAGATVVCLVPSRTDTAWWHKHVIGHAEVRFVRGRIRFVGAKASAPFPCAILIYRPDRITTGGHLEDSPCPVVPTHAAAVMETTTPATTAANAGTRASGSSSRPCACSCSGAGSRGGSVGLAGRVSTGLGSGTARGGEL